MPVRKYRSVGEMEGNTWRRPGDPELFRAMRATWGLAGRIVRPTFPPGLYRHRSIEAAQRLRAEWERANLAAYRKRVELLESPCAEVPPTSGDSGPGASGRP
jgi:hypothetical protein